MSDSVFKEHPLTQFMRKQVAVADAGVHITLEPFLQHFNLRGDPAGDFGRIVQKATGQSLPEVGRVSRGAHSVYWLGPDEFLLVSDSNVADSLVAGLASTHHGCTNLGGGQMRMTVSGPHARDFLSKASTLDFDAGSFRVDDCAQSTFAKAGALFALRDDTPLFELVVRRSFLDYAAQWMAHAGQEFGIVFRDPA
ncbi:MAG: sarcosine oxidase subunit gamma family protein [Pseudomonadota bacterium]